MTHGAEAGLQVVVGMTLSYAASLAGLLFAWYHYRKRRAQADQATGAGTRRRLDPPLGEEVR